MAKSIVIATRKSPLALWQAQWVKDQLESYHPGLQVSLLPLTTMGDVQLEQSLTTIGGKRLFIKELEQALLKKQAHIAVHSLKDVPAELPDPFILGAILLRQEHRDALVSSQGTDISDLPKGAIVGTASLRRQSQLLALRSDLVIKILRGNVNTRLSKLDEGMYDAIILAAVGLQRLSQTHRIVKYLPEEMMLPAVGQGAIAIECLKADTIIQRCIEILNHPPTVQCVTAERAMNKMLNGSCQVPIGGYARFVGDQLHLRGFVGRLDGQAKLYAERMGAADQPEQLGEAVACDLLAQGAIKLLNYEN